MTTDPLPYQYLHLLARECLLDTLCRSLGSRFVTLVVVHQMTAWNVQGVHQVQQRLLKGQLRRHLIRHLKRTDNLYVINVLNITRSLAD